MCTCSETNRGSLRLFRFANYQCVVGNLRSTNDELTADHRLPNAVALNPTVQDLFEHVSMTVQDCFKDWREPTRAPYFRTVGCLAIDEFPPEKGVSSTLREIRTPHTWPLRTRWRAAREPLSTRSATAQCSFFQNVTFAGPRRKIDSQRLYKRQPRTARVRGVGGAIYGPNSSLSEA